MRGVLAIAAGSMVLSGCGKAVAAAPDSRNPAHCIAALTMAQAWNDADKSSRHPEYSAQYKAIAAYEVEKIRRSGGSVDDTIEEAVAFNHAYHKDPRVVDLLVNCLKIAAEDPNLRPLVPRPLLNDGQAPAGN
jgi:hypothetical protein